VRTQIIQPPVDTRVLLGHTATLQCKVSSDPTVPFEVAWFHNNEWVLKILCTIQFGYEFLSLSACTQQFIIVTTYYRHLTTCIVKLHYNRRETWKKCCGWCCYKWPEIIDTKLRNYRSLEKYIIQLLCFDELQQANITVENERILIWRKYTVYTKTKIKA